MTVQAGWLVQRNIQCDFWIAADSWEMSGCAFEWEELKWG